MLNPIILGALARAKSLYPVRICAFAFLSNHFHLTLEVDDARQLTRFMGHFNSKLAREVGRLTGWREKVFGRRYQAILISSEDRAQIERLRYVLSHGCKEGLVERLQEWPGVHCVHALMEGKTLEGWWFDRTQEYLAGRRGEDFGRFQYATRETLELDPLPCWKHLTPSVRLAPVPPPVPRPAHLHLGCTKDFPGGFRRTITRARRLQWLPGEPTIPRTGLAPAGLRNPGGLSVN
jgi:REP element-mobilizing transposase RayT